MKKIVDEVLPILTVSESNTHEHWTKSYKRHTHQKKQIRTFFLVKQSKITLPCNVVLTRLSPRKLDSHDNLPTSFKYIVDTIADCILRTDNCPYVKKMQPGHADSDPRITWIYKQEKSKEKGIRLEIYS